MPSGLIKNHWDFFLCGISPAQWPPLFDRPWFSTWHQLQRHTFFVSGGIPVYYFFGRLGGAIGVFLVAGFHHYIWLWGLGRGTDFCSLFRFFLIMGVGTIAEYAFKRVAGHRVGGLGGWVWAILWGTGWGNMAVNAWLERGLGRSALMPHELRPSIWLVGLMKKYGWDYGEKLTTMPTAWI